MSKTKDDICPNCGAKMQKYWQSLTPGLLTCLVKFARTAQKLRQRSVHLKNVGFTRNEYNNFQKLRYFDMVAFGAGEGEWEVTSFGWDFIRGKVTCSKRVLTYRAKVEDRDPEQVRIWTVLGETPVYWQKEFSGPVARGALDTQQPLL